MKRATAIIGRFAFGGWLLTSAIIFLVVLFLGFTQRSFLEWTGTLLMLLVYGLLGFAGGTVVGVVAAVVDRLIKQPAGKAASEAASENKAASDDPASWPPAPKPPQ